MQLRQDLLQRRYRRGFTFIEIGLALAVIAVLVAIALPSYSRYRERVQVAQAVIDIGNLQSLIVQYYYNNQAYPNSLTDIGQAGMRDPWGNAYQYTNLSAPGSTGAARKNRSLVPINSDFDLYSRGKDGASASPLTASTSRDDIVRANDGRFIGLASDYDR
jgi:general secretion pathway protein G